MNAPVCAWCAPGGAGLFVCGSQCACEKCHPERSLGGTFTVLSGATTTLTPVGLAVVAEAVKLTCGPDDEPSTPAEEALVALDLALGPNAPAAVELARRAVWAAWADNLKPLHDAVKAADACACPKEIGAVPCPECGGFGTGPDKVSGPGDVYQDPCPNCDGKGRIDAPRGVS